MRHFTVDTAVVTREAAALVEPRVLEGARIQGLVVTVADPADLEVGGATQGRIGVGFSADDVQLCEAVDLYFHVGAAAHLRRKRGVCIPLTEQAGAGVRNVLRWALATRAKPQPVVSHSDVTRHADRCAMQYRDEGHVAKMERASREAAADLITAFPEVQVILGTGFPFYCLTRIDQPERSTTPTSILHYTATQAEFFRRKLIPTDSGSELSELSAASRQIFTPNELLARGIDVGQTPFNAYEYRRWCVEPPEPPSQGTLRDYVEANTLELKERDWPCHLCTTLHDSSRFPEQAWERDFMVSCLQCNQTAFIPRAVGVLGSDIDLVALASTQQDPMELAREIARWIDLHPRYFRHDTRWHVQLGCENGPLDVFVASIDDFLASANQIADSEEWLRITVDAAVTWLPITHLNYELGKYMPLCMEVLCDHTRIGPMGFANRFDQARRRFAMRVTAEQVLDAYAHDSEYLRQLASNPSIGMTLGARFSLWRGQLDRAEA